MLVVIYPYITGLVAGAFILASLAKVFNVKEIEPTYRFALLIALAFLIVAPLPLQMHLGHPERSFEIFLTPHFKSAMAMFGFVYAWYLMLVLLLEIWFEYRADLVVWSRKREGGSRRSSSGSHARVAEPLTRRRSSSTARPSTPSRSSASHRPSCCTATSASSSARSRPIRGGAAC